jgi:RES domain-containing protein
MTDRPSRVSTTDPPAVRIRWTNTCRLIPTRYPSVGVFDRVASPEDLDAVLQLESWTNDRISVELGMLTIVPRDEWVTGRPHATVIMAAFCHPRPGGGRFSDPDRGAWYAARTVETALAESIYHRTKELEEVGGFETRMQMRLYHADFRTSFHDLRLVRTETRALYDPDSYVASQAFARGLRLRGSHGLVYRSVRHAGGECLACYRPPLVLNVRVAAHYEFRWEGRRDPAVIRLTSAER